jgi:hypothetical protein
MRKLPKVCAQNKIIYYIIKTTTNQWFRFIPPKQRLRNGGDLLCIAWHESQLKGPHICNLKRYGTCNLKIKCTPVQEINFQWYTDTCLRSTRHVQSKKDTAQQSEI